MKKKLCKFCKHDFHNMNRLCGVDIWEKRTEDHYIAGICKCYIPEEYDEFGELVYKPKSLI